MNTTKPAFITFTGADRSESIPGMQALAARYPIEWGILIDSALEGQPLFPNRRELHAIRSAGLRLSAHICGAAASDIVNGRDPGLDLGGFARAQINHGFHGSSAGDIENSYLLCARYAVRPILQCLGAFPDDARVDWLYDISFGNGIKPAAWPELHSERPFCGYAGGLGPATIGDAIRAFQVKPGLAYWIDMESGVLTDGKLDLAKCEAVCKAVYDEKA